ncbi:MAG: DUF1289 domain-containing protein [Clostridia bacterium]|nr:DUF1289 domain-containing protein [Clostridia bacterium]
MCDNCKSCALYERACVDCGECDVCDLDENKVCDSCGRCIDEQSEYKVVKIKDLMKDEH